MKARKIRENIYWLGAIDWDRRMFDALIPLPEGTSYNAYLIQGSEKTVLLDTVDPSMTDVLLAQLASISHIDYVVSHHAEQDHSGSIPAVLKKYPNAKVLTSTKGKGMLIDLLYLPEAQITTVADGERLSLGDKTLEFIYAPWVHWPETMLTYLQEEKILFSCDFFGSHFATSELYAADESQVFASAKRYYAEIMMPFHVAIQKHLEKLATRDISMIAPSHGPIYARPAFILDAYHEWVMGEPKNMVALPYISMHDSTKKMVNYLISALAEKGVGVECFDLANTDLGKLAMALVDAATIVIGTPTVLGGPHPNVSYAAALVNTLRPKLKFASVIGSYGWSSKAIEQITGLIPDLKVEVLPAVMCKGQPRAAEFAALEQLAATIAEKHKENNCT